MLDYRRLIELGLSPDIETLSARAVAVAQLLGFGLCSGVLIRGRFGAASASIQSFGNPPEAFLESSRSLDDGLRDPLLARLLSRPGHASYGQALYVEAGVADLWDCQAAYGYRNGLSVSAHHPSLGEAFLFGIDSPDALPEKPAKLLELQAPLQMIAAHAESALRRLVLTSTQVELEPAECAVVQTVGANMYTQRGSLFLVERISSPAFASAARKLGGRSVTDVVLRAIDGGLIDR